MNFYQALAFTASLESTRPQGLDYIFATSGKSTLATSKQGELLAYGEAASVGVRDLRSGMYVEPSSARLRQCWTLITRVWPNRLRRALVLRLDRG